MSEMEGYFQRYYGPVIAKELAGEGPQPTLTLKQIQSVLYHGRTAVNFGHVPEVSRALDWLAHDFRKACGVA
jgi:hypothetical protein